MMHELSRSLDSSRTNSRELLEVVLHKKDDDRQHPQQHQPLLSHQHHLPSQRLQQMHQLRSTDSGGSSQIHQLRSTDSNSRLSAMLMRTAHLAQNNLGELSRGPSSFSRKSLSRQSLDSNSHESDTCETRAHGHHTCTTAWTLSGVGTFLNSLGLIALASLILASMSIFLLASLSQEGADVTSGQYILTEAVENGDGDSYSTRGGEHKVDVTADTENSKRQTKSPNKTKAHPSATKDNNSDGSGDRKSIITTSKLTLTRTSGESSGKSGGMQSLLEAAVAMATLVVVADLCCLMVCSMQCFFASKLLNMHQGEERSVKYLRECSSSRFIAVMGFFLSIPAFLVALMLAVLLKLTSGPALTSCTMLGVGVLFCVLSVMQNVYHWRVEKTRADEGLPVYETQLLLRHRAPSPSRAHSRGTSSRPPPCQPPLSPSAIQTGTQGELDEDGQKNELSTLV